MTEKSIDIQEEKKRLVLERFKTLNQDSKIFLGGGEEITVKEMINHIQSEDDFGKRIIAVQIKMLQAFAK